MTTPEHYRRAMRTTTTVRGETVYASDVLDEEELVEQARREPVRSFRAPRLAGQRVDEYGYTPSGEYRPERDGVW